ncbi:MAG: hypothetical protein A4E58_01007 [Syntrophorhabdus sp. PtaB.Bin006]|nr:MAG: hypothetical protein A4E58_01007 [Syntrophorhabdus sp. PtaB.Bin006]
MPGNVCIQYFSCPGDLVPGFVVALEFRDSLSCAVFELNGSYIDYVWDINQIDRIVTLDPDFFAADKGSSAGDVMKSAGPEGPLSPGDGDRIVVHMEKTFDIVKVHVVVEEAQVLEFEVGGQGFLFLIVELCYFYPAFRDGIPEFGRPLYNPVKCHITFGIPYVDKAGHEIEGAEDILCYPEIESEWCVLKGDIVHLDIDYVISVSDGCGPGVPRYG